MGKMLQAGYTS